MILSEPRGLATTAVLVLLTTPLTAISGLAQVTTDESARVATAADVSARGAVAACQMEIVTQTTDGRQLRAGAWGPDMSADGRYVVFYSPSHLVSDDNNAARDVYLRDTLTATTTRVSVSSAGAQADKSSILPSISADGQIVAFQSDATNLVPHDRNGRQDVFVRDIASGTTRRVSHALDESQAPALSADGRYVAFATTARLVDRDTNRAVDVYVRDLATASTSLVSISDTERSVFAGGNRPSISAHGRLVAFESAAAHLVKGDTNDAVDIFVRDRGARSTELVSIASDGSQTGTFSEYPTISATGRYVLFNSPAENLAPPADTNHNDDVFLRDRVAGTTERVSVGSLGQTGDSGAVSVSMSAGARYVAFTSGSANLVPEDADGWSDVFVRDRVLETTELVSPPDPSDASSYTPDISADGRYVAFPTNGSFVAEDTDGRVDIYRCERTSP